MVSTVRGNERDLDFVSCDVTKYEDVVLLVVVTYLAMLVDS